MATVSNNSDSNNNTTTSNNHSSSNIDSNNNNDSNTNNTNINTNNTNNNNNSNLNSQETCLICGDVASGKHYGLRSCEACKAFFKRTVQGKIEYSCPATRECEINKRRRKACQACRFQKCLNMGMLKEGVRLDRVRGGRQKYRRGLSPGPNGAGGGNNNNNINVNGPNGAGCSSSTTTSTNNLSSLNQSSVRSGNNSNSTSTITRQTQANSSISDSSGYCSSSMTASEAHRIMTTLINNEPEELTTLSTQYAANIPSTLSLQMKTLYILSDLFDRELVSLIGWAKQIPGFTEGITLNDQMRLLQSTWAEVIALSIGYRSHLKRIETFKQHANGSHFMDATPSPTSSSPASTASSYNHSFYGINSIENTEIRLVFAKDLIVDFKHAVSCGMEEIFYNCVQLIKRLDDLRITPQEYRLLKAISLTNADVRLESPRETHRLRDLVMDALYETTMNDSSINSGNSISNLNQKDNNGNITSLTKTNHSVKLDAQERPPSSMNQYASSPLRSSFTMPPTCSTAPTMIGPNIVNNNNNNSNSVDTISKKNIVNYRLNQVLLCLPVLRQIDLCIRKFWNDVRKGPNSVPMNKLFEEMLEPYQRIYKSSIDM